MPYQAYLIFPTNDLTSDMNANAHSIPHPAAPRAFSGWTGLDHTSALAATSEECHERPALPADPPLHLAPEWPTDTSGLGIPGAWPEARKPPKAGLLRPGPTGGSEAGLGWGFEIYKPRPVLARPKPGLAGQARAWASLFMSRGE
jgi:hypothetical protein